MDGLDGQKHYNLLIINKINKVKFISNDFDMAQAFGKNVIYNSNTLCVYIVLRTTHAKESIYIYVQCNNICSVLAFMETVFIEKKKILKFYFWIHMSSFYAF